MPGAEDRAAQAIEVHRRLLCHIGERPLRPRRRPMHELISTMLSHRTTQHNEALAYEAMWRRYGSWEAIRDAPVDELAQTIRQANFAESKARNIQEALRRIIEHSGGPSIDFLKDMPDQEALAWLMSLPGVGIKTASLVLLFCFSKPLLPVDSHIHRVSRRLGLIGPNVTPAAAHTVLLDLLPRDPHLLLNFHVNMLRLGQRVCRWRSPDHAACPLTDICDHYLHLEALA